MKIWKFYRVPEKSSVKKKYDLYGFTNNKSFAKRFISERDVENCFVVSGPDEIEKEEFIEFANKNRGQLIDLYKYETKGIKDNKYIIDCVEILSTHDEHLACNSSDTYLEEQIFDTTTIMEMPTYKIFNKKIIKALRKIEFIKYYKLLANNPSIDEIDDDYTAPEFLIDEVAVFIKLFHYLFK